jgi:RNA polymerase sigma factor (sigma-70 family)
MSRGTLHQGNTADGRSRRDWDLAATARLSVDDTTELLARYQATGDIELRNQVVQANLRLVAYLAGRFKGSTLSQDELMSEGAAALLRAADTFDPTRGVSFGAYAATAITHSMRRALGTAHDIVAIPSQVRRRLSRHRRAKDSFFAAHGRLPAASEIPVEARTGTLNGPRPAEIPTRSCDAAGAPELAAADAPDGPDAVSFDDVRHMVRDAVGSLDDASADVVRLRFGLDTNGAPRGWRHVAHQLGITVPEAKARMAQALGVLRVRLGAELNDPEDPDRLSPSRGIAA